MGATSAFGADYCFDQIVSGTCKHLMRACGDEQVSPVGEDGETTGLGESMSMGGDWSDDARAILDELQAKVTARDLPALLQFFDDPAVLIGAAGDGRTPERREEYLEAQVMQRAQVRWDWRETLLYYEAKDALGFAAFGEVVLVEGIREVRAPIRGTFFAVRTNGRWRLRQFHGSTPHSPN